MPPRQQVTGLARAMGMGDEEEGNQVELLLDGEGEQRDADTDEQEPAATNSKKPAPKKTKPKAAPKPKAKASRSAPPAKTRAAPAVTLVTCLKANCLCDKKPVTIAELDKIHSRPTNCPGCEQTAPNFGEFIEHVDSCGLAGDCPTCNSHQQAVASHFLRCAYPHDCGYGCGERFSSVIELQRHELTCDKADLTCPFCKVATPDGGERVTHAELCKHNPSYQCHVCGEQHQIRRADCVKKTSAKSKTTTLPKPKDGFATTPAVPQTAVLPTPQPTIPDGVGDVGRLSQMEAFAKGMMENMRMAPAESEERQAIREGRENAIQVVGTEDNPKCPTGVADYIAGRPMSDDKRDLYKAALAKIKFDHVKHRCFLPHCQDPIANPLTAFAYPDCLELYEVEINVSLALAAKQPTAGLLLANGPIDAKFVMTHQKLQTILNGVKTTSAQPAAAAPATIVIQQVQPTGRGRVQNTDGVRKRGRAASNKDGVKKCYNCDSTDHLAKDCTQPKTTTKGGKKKN